MKLDMFKWFTQKELENGKVIPQDSYKNIIPTAMVLDIARSIYGSPVYINSTYRDPLYNRAVGGASNSMHLFFNAIDFTVKGNSAKEKESFMKELYAQLEAFDKKGYLYPGQNDIRKQIMGLGLYLRGYGSFIHLDTRGLLGYKSPARWRG